LAIKVVTIGVYGCTEEAFFQALRNASVDVFCDLRMRRGMRGSTYAFANAKRLEQKLTDLGIRYVHIKELAPTEAIRAMQKREDQATGTAKRERNELGKAFIEGYRQDCLAHYDAERFKKTIGPSAKTVALFCVEREPRACHRSLVADYLKENLQAPVEDITPWVKS
jgi:uncharacterized protein (DUF488 family)